MSPAFVWRMEAVLDLYASPPDPRRPLVCFDERPLQLLAAIHPPQPVAPGHPIREDYEYRRCGTGCLAVRFDPQRRWRHVTVSAQRTLRDFAGWMQDLVDVQYPQAAVIRVVLDNLNTHTPAALYATFPPAEAHRLTRKLELHYTPAHGSWLHMVEIALSVLADQCLGRRVPDLATVARAVAAWETARHAARATIQWRFTTTDARTKLHRLYSHDSAW